MCVSLFTREWIEIRKVAVIDWHMTVSLFTREWIEMTTKQHGNRLTAWSPSLRGSGLKCVLSAHRGTMDFVSLFTREWIEIMQIAQMRVNRNSLPLYEGVD